MKKLPLHYELPSDSIVWYFQLALPNVRRVQTEKRVAQPESLLLFLLVEAREQEEASR